MTTLCLCDWVETREDREQRLRTEALIQTGVEPDRQASLPVLPLLPALTDWASLAP